VDTITGDRTPADSTWRDGSLAVTLPALDADAALLIRR
jgi:hypothetical protein